MRTIWLGKDDWHSVDNRAGSPATDDDYDVLIDEPAELRRRGDGALVALYGLTDLDDGIGERLATVRPDVGPRSGGMLSRSRMVGGRPRNPLVRLEYCGRASFDREYPGLYAELATLGETLGGWLQSAAPDVYAYQRDWLAAEVLPDYRMVGPFTSGILNFNNALHYHRDQGNLRGSWNAMVTFRRDATGGALVLPEWRVAFTAGHGHALLMNAGEVMHGVTPIVKRRRDGFRLSMVYYCLRGLAVCKSPADELTRSRRVRTEREERRAGLIP